jgi:hypothetical protein
METNSPVEMSHEPEGHIETLPTEGSASTANMIAGMALLGIGLDFSEYTEEQFATFRSREIPKIMWTEHKRRVALAKDSLDDVGASVKKSWFRHGGEKPRRVRGTIGHAIRYLTTLDSDRKQN